MTTPFERAAQRVRGGADAHAEARALVVHMTLAEKLDCLDGDVPCWSGLVDMTSGGYYSHPWPAAAVERLGVAGIHFADGPRGCVLGDCTAFPVSMARGASFDPDLEARIGEAMGAELRASGANFTGAVCMNLLRHPAWGRAQETYGEDPCHVASMAGALVRGLQRHVMACMKHFALNSMENARFRVDVTVDERALHEVYLAHFRRVAAEGVASVMSAYNSVNGHWCGENRVLLEDILRQEWGWDGFVISDFIFGLRDAVLSVQAGLDIEMPFRQQRALALPDAVASGTLEVADVERAVERIVATLLRFAEPPAPAPTADIIGCADHRALARETAVAASVLLRNEGDLLPMKPSDVRRLAVLGRLARVPNLGDGGSSDVRTSRVVTPLDGLRAVYGDAVVHSDADATIAAGADLVVVVVGCTKADEGEYIDVHETAQLVNALFPPADHPTLGAAVPMSPIAAAPAARREPPPPEEANLGSSGDRTSLRLSAEDEALIHRAAANNSRVAVVVQSGSAVVMPWASSAPAVLMTWYPGVEGGTALADLLSGAAEPGGRLPFVVPTDPAHLPAFDKDAEHAVYDLFHGQWKLDRDGVSAHYPFGWGLGYTKLTVDAARWAGDEGNVEVTVTNRGARAGSSVVFVHAGVESSAYERPRRRLVGFRRVHLQAGASAQVTLALDWAMLDIRRAGTWLTEPGTYVVDVGQHAADPHAITLTRSR